MRALTPSETDTVYGAKLPEEDLQDIARSKQEEERRKRGEESWERFQNTPPGYVPDPPPDVRFENAFKF